MRRVGDDSVGGPVVTRQLRLTRILMRDLLIGVCFHQISINRHFFCKPCESLV